jgi:hypothetical protein
MRRPEAIALRLLDWQALVEYSSSKAQSLAARELCRAEALVVVFFFLSVVHGYCVGEDQEGVE